MWGERLFRYASYGANVAILARRKSSLEPVAAKMRELGAQSVVIIDEDLSTEAGSRYSNRVLQSFGPWSSLSELLRGATDLP